MFSSFPGLFDKAFAIGFLLPVLILLILVTWLFPGIEVLAPLHTWKASEEALGKATYVVLMAYGGAIALAVANHGLYRLLEGYTPPLSWIGALQKAQETRRAKLLDDYDELMEEWEELQDGFSKGMQDRVNGLKRQLLTSYPPREQKVMPTRFGNVIKAFESYPLETYGADAIPLWLRLSSVIPKDFATEINDARSEVDCLVNLTVILSVLGGVLIALAAWNTPWAVAISAFPASILWVEPRALLGVLGLVLAFAAYRAATERAVAWGALVASAFDCYLPALAKQLGYALPAKEADRRAFWADISRLMIYRQPLEEDRWPLADAPAAAPKKKRFWERLFG